MSAIAKRAHRRLDALERAAKLVDKWRKTADALNMNNPETGIFVYSVRRCASELQEALEGK